MTDERLVEGIKKILAKLNDEKNQRKFRKWDKKISFHFTDINKTWYTHVAHGKASPPIEGEPENAEIKIITDSDTWLKIIAKEQKVMNAYSSGKLKVKASMRDLLKLQRVL